MRELKVHHLTERQRPLPDVTPVDHQARDPRPAPIEYVWIGEDPRRLTLEGVVGATHRLKEVRVSESRERVELTVMVGAGTESLNQRRKVGGIDLVGIGWRVDVILDRPLMGRPVFDKASGP